MKFLYWSLTLAASLLGGVLPPLTAAPETTTPSSAPLVTGLSDLKQLDQKLIAMADQAAAATVCLISTQGTGSGSGVIVDSDGLILSAAHVVSALAGEIIVLFPDGKRAKAKALGADFDRDAALLRITDPGSYPYVDLADSEPLPNNGWCVALGHPGGFDPLRTPPLRLGRIINYGAFIVTDCTVVSGDSGGPLFDTAGRVIGIHSNIGSSLGENRHVPIKVFRDQWDDLLAGKQTGSRFKQKPGGHQPEASKPPTPSKPTLGLKLGKESPDGITIDEVVKDSPAAKAGLLAGDVVVRLAGRKVTTAKEFAAALTQRKPRPKVMLTYQRNGEIKQLKVPFPAPVHPRTDADKAKAKADGEPPAATEQELNDLIDKCLADAKNGRAEIKLTPEQLAKFGGMEKFQELLKQRVAGKMKAPPNFKVEDRTKPPSPTTDQDKDELFAKLRDRAKTTGGRLQVTPAEVAKLGGMEELKKRLRTTPAAPDDFYLSVLKALKEITAGTPAATHTVCADGKPVALATAITAAGGVLTKNSETTKGKITVTVGDKDYPATVVKRFPEWDLALFHIPTGELHPVTFDASAPAPARGSLLAVPGPGTEPLGIGMVSVNSRPFGQIGFLGIQTDRTATTTGSVTAKVVQKDGPAAKAGFKDGDVITAVNDQPVADPIRFTHTIAKFKPNDRVKFEVTRGEEKLTLEATLGDRPMPKMGKDFLKVNQMSGPLSPKVDGFPLALQHDIPLEPSQCGGPLLDLDGHCLGINVARAGRVSTLAIPAGQVAALLKEAHDDLVAAAAAAPAPSADEVTAEEIAEVTKALEDLQIRLKKLEQRLRPAPVPAP